MKPFNALAPLTFISLCFAAYAADVEQAVLGYVEHKHLKVPVVLGVMSRCPDAHLCESVFDEVVQNVEDKIDLTLTFLGKTNASDPEFGVTCMHGRDECAGNIHELCAIKHEPFRKWWSFVQCENHQGRPNIGTPETALTCAETSHINWEGPTGKCAGSNGNADGEEGIQLLRDSVKATADLGITKSCTIIINGKQVCIRDSSWYSCPGGHSPEDFVRQINDEYEKLNN